MRRYKCPRPLEPLAVQPHREAAVALLLEQFVRAAVPDLDRARTVVPFRDLALEAPVLERMVLDVAREVLLTRPEGDGVGAGRRAAARRRSGPSPCRACRRTAPEFSSAVACARTPRASRSRSLSTTARSLRASDGSSKTAAAEVCLPFSSCMPVVYTTNTWRG